MHASHPTPASFVQRPSVMALFPWGAVCVAGLLWLACTFRYPDAGTPGPLRLVSGEVYATVCVVHGLLALGLCIDAWFTRRAPRSVRRAQWIGITLGLAFLAVAQFGIEIVWGPVPTPPGR